MSPRNLVALPIALAAAAALAACTFEAGPTVSASALADAAADALEGQIGDRPKVDCGEDDVIAKVDKAVDCTVIDPASGAEYGATVTFTSVEDQEWQIEVEVEDAPAGEETSETPAAAETSSAAADDQAAAEPIPATAIADAAADALETEMGSRPDIYCGADDLNIAPYEGRITYCTLTDPADGAEYEVTVTFVDVSGDTWNVSVVVDSEPK